MPIVLYVFLVGGGSAGAVVANRLSKYFKVLVNIMRQYRYYSCLCMCICYEYIYDGTLCFLGLRSWW